MYKFRITGADGVSRDKADPYAFRSELRPGTASVLWDLAEVHIRDEGWMSGRDKCYDRPLNIYELHAGSWRRNADGSWLNYAQLADQLVPYLKEMNFNFVELLPLSEHPFDGSWGTRPADISVSPAGTEPRPSSGILWRSATRTASA